MSGHVKRHNIFLTGMMGSGKSTIGAALATALDYAFVDTDKVIEQQQAMTVSEIFSKRGESYFREQERQVLLGIKDNENQVVATGGGMLANIDNFRIAADNGMVVLLQTSIAELTRRIGQQTNRPLLSGEEMKTRLQLIHETRKSLYDAIPFKVNTEGIAVDEAVGQIRHLYTNWLKE